MNTDYNRMHKQRIGRYVEAGVLWSELIRGLADGNIPSEGLTDLKRRVLPLVKDEQRVVAVFDSTYNNSTITGFRQGIAFVRGIQRLLEEREDIFVIFKEKKDPWIYPQLGWDTMGLEEEYSKLAAHPRCFMAGFQESQAAVIALADVTISFPFTSTTLEAIGAGRKAIYYDPLGSYKDTFYDEIPGFVVHDFDSLNKRVVELLYSINEVEYRNHLDKYARERVDRFLDGHALSRFRGLLCEEEVNGS
jgi:polysaccharide biosynthesis PFTS motif protein